MVTIEQRLQRLRDQTAQRVVWATTMDTLKRVFGIRTLGANIRTDMELRLAGIVGYYPKPLPNQGADPVWFYSLDSDAADLLDLLLADQRPKRN